MLVVFRAVRMNRYGTRKQRVLVISGESLLDEGVYRLLQGADNLWVRRLVYTDRRALLEATQQIQPDTLVLSESGPLNSTEVFDLLTEAEISPHLRIVVIREDNNFVDLYEKRRIRVLHHDNLVSMICGAD